MRCTILCRPRLSQEPRPPSAGQIGEHDTIDAKRNALVVIGVQNYFVAEDFPLEVPVAREIVPNISRLATAMRNVGGLVAWVQTTATVAVERCTVGVLWIVPVLRIGTPLLCRHLSPHPDVLSTTNLICVKRSPRS